MTIWERIDSFYAAPFTKFMGNLVTALIIIILFVFENTVNYRLKAPPLPPVIAPSTCKQKFTSDYKTPLPPPDVREAPSSLYWNEFDILWGLKACFRNNFLFEALQTKGK